MKVILALNYTSLKTVTGSLKTKSQMRLYGALPLTCLLVATFLFLPHQSFCQQEKKTVPDGTEGLNLKIPPEDSIAKKLPPNEFIGSISTFKVGFGYIFEGATFSQSAVFKKQMDSAGLVFDPKFETRDARILASGVLKTKRPISWKAGLMYDGDDKIWMMRETGVTIGVPEWFGSIFIGRTKEGYSMVKVMNGHSPWT